METKANYLVIGAFVLAVLAAGFGFVYWMQSFGSGGEKRYQIVFEGGVSGISTASNVLFNGIRVGKVQGGIVVARIQSEGLAELTHGVFRLSQVSEERAEMVPVVRVKRSESHGGLEAGSSLF